MDDAALRTHYREAHELAVRQALARGEPPPPYDPDAWVAKEIARRTAPASRPAAQAPAPAPQPLPPPPPVPRGPLLTAARLALAGRLAMACAAAIVIGLLLWPPTRTLRFVVGPRSWVTVDGHVTRRFIFGDMSAGGNAGRKTVVAWDLLAVQALAVAACAGGALGLVALLRRQPPA